MSARTGATSSTAPDPVLPSAEVTRAQAEASALEFLRTEAGFAQVTTLDRQGYPVTRSMTVFPATDWTIALVQRATHRRLAQWRAVPRTLVTWVGDPAPGMTNERPHVFDLGRLPSRVVAVRGDAEFMDDDWTVRTYRQHLDEQRAAGHTEAPVRTDDQVRDELVGVLIRPVRVRLEGFGHGPQSFDWTVT
ncbi:MAG: hypothetical protein GX555_07160 [Actinomycetales bacterium]|nr:hypothetical protein [Actinomycetales bacterium]